MKKNKIINLHMLLTDDIASTKPDSCKIIMDFGRLLVVSNDKEDAVGLHCIVEDTIENIVEWLKPFDGFYKGSGTPQFEEFSVVHISDAIEFDDDEPETLLTESKELEKHEQIMLELKRKKNKIKDYPRTRYSDGALDILGEMIDYIEKL